MNQCESFNLLGTWATRWTSHGRSVNYPMMILFQKESSLFSLCSVFSCMFVWLKVQGF